MQLFKTIPYPKWLGVEFISMADGKGVCRMVIQEDHCRTQGIVHGGAIMSLLDCTIGAAATSVLPDAQTVVTIQLNTNFIHIARPGQTLRAEAEVEHAGKRTAKVNAKILDENDRLIATASATMMFLDFTY
jgi:uncharacterized protein (TIGR00369 family)